MSYKVIVNVIDILKDIEYKENLIKDLKDIVSKQQKLLELYIKIYNGITDYHDYDELKEIQKQIKELENDEND